MGSGYANGPYIGLRNRNWVTGEAYAYTNWAPGDPNHSGDAVVSFWNSSSTPANQWADTAAGTATSFTSYIVEWDH